jgi:hypothetical protein
MSPLFLLGRDLESPKYKSLFLLRKWKYNGEDLMVELLKRREVQHLLFILK